LEVGERETYTTTIRIEPFAIVEGFSELGTTALVAIVSDVAVSALPGSGLAYGF